MSDSIPIIQIEKDKWIDVYAASGIAVGTVLEIQSLNAGDVRLHIGADKPTDADGYELVVKSQKTVTPVSPTGIWAYSAMGGAVYVREYIGETVPVPTAMHDGFNNPLSSYYDFATDEYVLNMHDADVHHVPINEYFHEHVDAVSALVAVNSLAGAISIEVDDSTPFTAEDTVQIEDGVIETTFPVIKSIVGNVLNFDRPLDNAFSIGDSVEKININMNVAGSILTPRSFKIIPDGDQVWHAESLTISMTHSGASDPSLFGDITALENGLLLRGYSGATGKFRTLTNWKDNAKIGLDFGGVDFLPKVGGGEFGTFASASIKFRSGANPRIDGAAGDYLEGLVQDPLDVTSMITVHMKMQGHIEGT